MESQTNFEMNLEQRISAENLVIDIDGFEGPVRFIAYFSANSKSRYA